ASRLHHNDDKAVLSLILDFDRVRDRARITLPFVVQACRLHQNDEFAELILARRKGLTVSMLCLRVASWSVWAPW
ncbi:MAG: hypothetical protein ACLQVF_05405, partial [Isosphaeraceae bacterium]